MPPRRATPRRRNGIFHRESTRLRSNVADQVQRDLLPAGRMLSVFLVVCELLAEVAVLIWTRGQPCDRPLRFWVVVLILLQTGTVILNCLNIWYGRDSFGQHRNGLSASDLAMYTDSPLPSAQRSSDSHTSESTNDSVSVQIANDNTSDDPCDYPTPSSQPLLDRGGPSSAIQHSEPSHSTEQSPLERNYLPSSPSTPEPVLSESSSSAFVSADFVDRYVRIVNAWYLVWFILGSIWVSDGGSCSRTAPNLYRLIVALTIIYYALLFLPLACFCLIVCCLPLFILVYRIMLPYAERERRRARAADPDLVRNLTSIVYSPETFSSHTGNENLEDASCVICLCDYEEDEVVRFLPCKHHFHKSCVDVWLRLDKACCLCKQDIDSRSLV